MSINFLYLSQSLVASKAEDNSFFGMSGILPKPAIQSFLAKTFQSYGTLFFHHSISKYTNKAS
jgi:hypothetical protein